MVLYQIVCSLSIYNKKSIHPNFVLQFVKLFHVEHFERWPVGETGGACEGLGE